METLIPLASFAFITSFTPGPNNMLLLASGLRFGFVKSLPHIMGIQMGIAMQLILAALGVSYIIVEIPEVNIALKVLGSFYLLYLAWNLRPQSLTLKESKEAKPFTFIQAFLFQFINQKAWIMTVTAGSLFLPNLSSHVLSTLVLCLTFNCVGTPSSGSWVLVGGIISHYLNTPLWRKCFSFLMVGLTLFTVAYLWWV